MGYSGGEIYQDKGVPMNAVNHTPAQLKQVLADTPKDQPVVMLNLLRFRDRASYDDNSGERSGREAYELYIQEAAACVSAVGAEIDSQLTSATSKTPVWLISIYAAVPAAMESRALRCQR